MAVDNNSTPTDGEILDNFLLRHSVRYIRLQWVDLSGVQHAQLVTVRMARELAAGQTNQFSLAQNCMIIPISTAPKSFPVAPEAWEIHPDWSSLTLCGFAPKHGSVMCCMYLRAAESPLAQCPRTLLQRTVAEFEEVHSTKLLVGFEAEFVLLDESLSPPVRPLDPVSGDSTMGGLRGANLDLMQEVVEAMETAGTHVFNFHTEGVNHFEIALAPLAPMASIDALMNLHETIRTVSLRYGLKASLAPRPMLDAAQLGAQNGCHMHLSLNPPMLDANCFLAGILRRLPALCAFGMANFDSYSRVIPDGAGLWVGWGTENRDLPVRTVQGGRWELRFADATANLYLFLAAVIASGADGVNRAEELTWKDTKVFPKDMSAEELRSNGIVQPMPRSLRESLSALWQENDIKRWVGHDLFKQYCTMKEVEVQMFSLMLEDERRRRFLRFF